MNPDYWLVEQGSRSLLCLLHLDIFLQFTKWAGSLPSTLNSSMRDICICLPVTQAGLLSVILHYQVCLHHALCSTHVRCCCSIRILVLTWATADLSSTPTHIQPLSLVHSPLNPWLHISFPQTVQCGLDPLIKSKFKLNIGFTYWAACHR